jgi:hypothetical protein
MRTHLRYLFLLATTSFVCVNSFAQKQPVQKQSIDIISSYKPFLRNPVKINLTATNLNADTSRPVLKYIIPAQNLFYTYTPTPIKPLALDHDTSLDLGTRNFIKAGAGNYATPYINAGFSFGDGKKELINLYGDYISSTGKIKYQDYSHGDIKATGSFFKKSNEYYGLLEMKQDDYNLYGYDHAVHNYTVDSVARYYQTIRFKAGFRNSIPNKGGFDYDPTIDVKMFTSEHNLVENTAIINAPVIKKLTDDISLKVTGVADITSYSVDSSSTVHASFNNNIFQIAPEVIIQQQDYIAHIGLTPSWNNNTVNVLPNVYGEVHLRKQLFVVQAGVVGSVIKNSFSNLSAINPYIQTITSTQNTKEVEIYGGLKSSISKHFSASGKVSIITYNNLPLFINDTTLDGKTFYISNEPKLNDFRLHFDMSYINGDKFTATGGVTLDQYSGLQKNAKAWGYIPVELNTSIRWEAFKDVVFKGNLYAFSSTPFLLKNNIVQEKNGADLSIGTEIGITKRLSAWLDLNNLLNNKYQRWNNYEVYGLNVLGGIVYRF